MASAIIQGIRLAGIASAVPDTFYQVTSFNESFGAANVQRISKITGIEQRALGSPRLCCSDLCCAAVKRLLEDLNWDPETIDGLIFVSQSFDFPCVPATSCIMQMRLGLPKSCAAFDIALGCSGYVYGLWVAASLLSGGGLHRVLVLTGDVNRAASPEDRSTAMLFGDAGSATALEKAGASSPFAFLLGTDGTGWSSLIIPAGIQSSRHPRNEETRIRHRAEAGNCRSMEDIYMDGAEIFAFTLREVPPLVSSVLKSTGWNKDEVDYFVFHQANEFILRHLAESMELPLPKMPLSLKAYGNTSSASIPLTISSKLRNSISTHSCKLLMAGFGVGYSWGACTMTCGPLIAPPVIMVNESEAWQC